MLSEMTTFARVVSDPKYLETSGVFTNKVRKFVCLVSLRLPGPVAGTFVHETRGSAALNSRVLTLQLNVSEASE
jgi:hypothetical protein